MRLWGALHVAANATGSDLGEKGKSERVEGRQPRYAIFR
jgi:hypothetical protein